MAMKFRLAVVLLLTTMLIILAPRRIEDSLTGKTYLAGNHSLCFKQGDLLVFERNEQSTPDTPPATTYIVREFLDKTDKELVVKNPKTNLKEAILLKSGNTSFYKKVFWKGSEEMFWIWLSLLLLCLSFLSSTIDFRKEVSE